METKKRKEHLLVLMNAYRNAPKDAITWEWRQIKPQSTQEVDAIATVSSMLMGSVIVATGKLAKSMLLVRYQPIWYISFIMLKGVFEWGTFAFNPILHGGQILPTFRLSSL